MEHGTTADGGEQFGPTVDRDGGRQKDPSCNGDSSDVGATAGAYSAARPEESEVSSVDVPQAAVAIFGDRLPLAVEYHRALATDGVARGLIGPREVDRLWDRHILNCAVLGEAIREGESVVDVGSGAGLPGIPLAIARPDVFVTLVEPLLRRTIFLDEIRERLGLSFVVRRGRAEEKDLIADVGGADVVTSRAVAPLDRLARWCIPLARSGGRLVALKGDRAASEIDEHRAVLARLGAINPRVETVGAAQLDVPTRLVVADVVKRGRR